MAASWNHKVYVWNDVTDEATVSTYRTLGGHGYASLLLGLDMPHGSLSSPLTPPPPFLGGRPGQVEWR